MSDYQEWLGRTRESRDVLGLERATAMRATLGGLEALALGDPLPPLWHWLYFWEIAAAEQLGYDGHPTRGDFLPPLPLKRRMWAGSRLAFLAPLPLGAAVTRRSTIRKIEMKEGRSGPLGFVTVGHTLHADGLLALEEEHDIVYRAPPRSDERPSQGQPAPGEAAWTKIVTPDPTLLFRYSALTFNGHRIHYDRRFCQESEGDPGLVVHGPLLATLMVELVRQRGTRPIASFRFRALAPLFDTADFTVCGQPDEAGAAVWVAGADGQLKMQGAITWG